MTAADDAGRSTSDLVESASATAQLINQVSQSTAAQSSAVVQLENEDTLGALGVSSKKATRIAAKELN